MVEIELTLVLDNWRRRHAIGRVNNLNAAMVVDLVVDSPVNCPISPLIPWRPSVLFIYHDPSIWTWLVVFVPVVAP